MTCINMGLNTVPGDKGWDELVTKFVEAVETFGEASASWSCTGRTRHYMQACRLQESLKDKGYDWTVGYNYECYARKVS